VTVEEPGTEAYLRAEPKVRIQSLQQKSLRTFGSAAISARSWSAVAANLDRFARAEKLENHEWEAAGHNDVDEFGVAEFLAQEEPLPRS
jgi:hypothetical protein